jgi:hypothetical protein
MREFTGPRSLSTFQSYLDATDSPSNKPFHCPNLVRLFETVNYEGVELPEGSLICRGMIGKRDRPVCHINSEVSVDEKFRAKLKCDCDNEFTVAIINFSYPTPLHHNP